MVRVGRRTELADLRRLTTGAVAGRPLSISSSTPDDFRLTVARLVSVANLVSVASAIIGEQTSKQEQEGTKEFRETFEKCID